MSTLGPDDFAELDRRFAPLREMLASHLTLTQEICRRLVRQPAPFGVVTTSAAYAVNENKRGVIRFIGNPTSVDLHVKVYDGADGGNGVAKINTVLAPGETRPVFAVFHSGLLSFGDAGATIDGELFS